MIFGLWARAELDAPPQTPRRAVPRLRAALLPLGGRAR
jgi:hypothetical protein